MKSSALLNSFIVGLSLFMGLMIFTLNAGCEGNTAQTPVEKAQSGEAVPIEIQSGPDKAPEATSSPRAGMPFYRPRLYEWDPFAWMEEFRREMDRSFEDRYAPFRWHPSREDEPSQWLREFQDEMDHFFKRSRSRWQPGEFARIESALTPRVDIYEDENNVVVRVDLPGMEKEAIDVTVTGNLLTLKGERKQETEIKREDYRSFERQYGAFHRSITLPPYADTDNPVSSYENGVLEIRFPRKAEPAKKRIKLI